MNRILFCLGLIVAFQPVLRAQDAAMVERVNRLSVYVDELMADKVRYQKQILDLEREVESLKRELKRVEAGASNDDVKALANTVRELDARHQKDMKSVADTLDKLAKTAARPATPAPAPRASGWDHTIEAGQTLSAIAQAYRDHYGVKTTASDILKANPGLDERRLQIGQVIFVPEK